MTKVQCCCAVLCWAEQCGWTGDPLLCFSRIIILSFFSPLPLTPQLCDSGTVGRSTKGCLHSFPLKHTLAVAHTQDNVRGSSLNAIRGSEICLTEPQQNNLHTPVKRFQNIIARQEGAEDVEMLEILISALSEMFVWGFKLRKISTIPDGYWNWTSDSQSHAWICT